MNDPAGPVTEAVGLSVGYGPLPVVRDFNLTVNAGEVVVLVGANGAGKTTTMLALAGELRPMDGSVSWCGHVTTAPLHRRAKQGLRFVTESRSVIGCLSTADNLRLGGGSPKRALELFPELEPLLKRPARLLSGGEQRMLALGRAISARPRLLLADELTLGLAPIVSRRLLEAVRSTADEGTAVLLVEQQVRLARQVADRAYVMRRGRHVFSGPAGEVFDRAEELESTYLAGYTDDAVDTDASV